MPIPVAGFTILRVPLTVGAGNLYARETGVALAQLDEDWPIDNVPWDAARRFCDWYGEATGQRVRYRRRTNGRRASGRAVATWPTTWRSGRRPRAARTATSG